MKEVEELNKAYFKSLANTRASASMMLISFTGAVIFGVKLYLIDFGLQKSSNIFFNFILLYSVYLIVATVIPLGMSFIYRKQILSTILLLLSYIGIFLSLMLTCYILFTVNNNGFQELNESSIPVILFLVIFTVCGFIYQYFWLMRQLKNGFSASRTVRNYFAKSSAYSQESILIIFMLVLLTSTFLGKFALVLGITSTLLYCYAFPQLIIEVAYLLYLKTQSKEYWETESDGEVSFRNLFKEFSLKKAEIRIPLEIFLLLLIIYIDGGNAYINVFINQTRWLLWLIRIFIISIGLDILGSFILYVIKKVNTRFKKRKKKR
ncbi:hypothetical protein D8786_09365 [Streptococcus mitis]|uniref:Uncharacterized protein n=1 Tax=Streptococcus mitis TaxID=28037 RepID=A0A428HDA8_STRMT|nr:hypothetical protein [Streptococcus mitis]RSJ93947.1 hypothetical protein D8786_09365 [Streptococcus mitis]